MRRRAFTLVEIMVTLVLTLLLLFAVYRLFFSEILSIRRTLEHIELNENARLFLTRFSNDVRNANWLDFPAPSVREGVPILLPSIEGKVCAFTSQVFDFSIKPPDPRFLRKIKIEYRLKKAEDGTFDLHRDVFSEVPATPGGPFPYKSTRRICQGVKEIFVFSSIHRAPKMSSFPGLPLKSLLVFQPYELDGTGPNLIHVRISFVRKSNMAKSKKDENPLVIRTCFAIRGRLNSVNP